MALGLAIDKVRTEFPGCFDVLTELRVWVDNARNFRSFVFVGMVSPR